MASASAAVKLAAGLSPRTLRAMTDPQSMAAQAGPGPCNDLGDVAGLTVGHAEDAEARTGVTVVLPDGRAAAAVDVRGGGPGTRETDLLGADAGMSAIDALVLSGGSVFGLEAAGGVVAWLAAAGRGFPVVGRRVPIVPAAIIFDLVNGGDKSWAEPGSQAQGPYHRLGREAVAAAEAALRSGLRQPFGLGNRGAGYGARAGWLKGGIGSASLVTADGLAVAALVVANPVGSVVRPGSMEFWARPYELQDEFGGHDAPLRPAPAIDLPGESRIGGGDLMGANTTIGVVATNLDLDKAALRRVAMMAHDGFARAIRPVHTPFDGDTLFALATGRQGRSHWPDAAQDWLLARCGTLAADCVARAVARGVFEAESLGEAMGYRAVLAGQAPGGQLGDGE